MIINATFNTNKNNLLLLILIYIINTLRTFLIAYYYITSKLVKVFTFMNSYIKKLFFYKNCRGITILLGDFAINLTTAIIVKRKLSLLEAGLKVT